eukprot:TRINITY_DN960_c0_g3_i1.p1 TRINITY_DN960_c0_g3~~TRINITY_DN960_c0_g3_i1.p1  ORF type:complete len:135 (-),score=31.50 TRINITY_DN960_c0_g3_i1:400-804(-)
MNLQNSTDKYDKIVETFLNQYYKEFDGVERANILPQWYDNNASLIWNGNFFSGTNSIRDFFGQLAPTKTAKSIQTYSYQFNQNLPVSFGTHPIIIFVCGRITIGCVVQSFSQTFLLIPISEQTFKISYDCLRTF